MTSQVFNQCPVLLDSSSQCVPSISTQGGSEAFFDEADTSFSGQNAGRSLTSGMTDANAGLGTTQAQAGTNPAVLNPTGTASSTAYDVGQGMTTADAEALQRHW